jgi:hypothetical protein
MTLKLEELTERARVAVREAMKKWPPLPEHLRSNLVVGTEFSGADRVFELYVAAERPQDATVLARVSVNSATGAVGPVEVFPERWVAPSE